MMLGEQSESAAYWKKCGDEALKNGVKGIIMMVSLLLSVHQLQIKSNIDEFLAIWRSKLAEICRY